MFCEVKTRRLGLGRAVATASHAAKQAQVRRMAAAWLLEPSDRPWHDELRFDADRRARRRVDDALVRLDHLEGAF